MLMSWENILKVNIQICAHYTCSSYMTTAARSRSRSLRGRAAARVKMRQINVNVRFGSSGKDEQQLVHESHIKKNKEKDETGSVWRETAMGCGGTKSNMVLFLMRAHCMVYAVTAARLVFSHPLAGVRE